MKRALAKETRRTQWGQPTGHRSDGDGKDQSQLDTVLKVLASLGKTLAVVPLEQERSKRNQKNYYGNNTNLSIALPSSVELSGCARSKMDANDYKSYLLG